MRKSIDFLTVILFFITCCMLVLGFWGISINNSILTSYEEVRNKESVIEVQLQRRADLIPNFVETVKEYEKHEEEVFVRIAEAREKLAFAIENTDLSSANVADDELSKEFSNLMAIVENYPELKASKNFIALQDEIAGSENRIAIAREEYNKAVTSYNKIIKMFPSMVIAQILGYEEIPYFVSDNEAKDAPKVNF